MVLAKLTNSEIDIRFCPKEHGARMAELRNDGFLDFVASDQPVAKPGYVAVDSFDVQNGKIVQSWTLKVDPVSISERIDALKKELSSSDYMIIKCMEASLMGEEMPYDLDEIHANRQAIRDEINSLEELL